MAAEDEKDVIRSITGGAPIEGLSVEDCNPEGDRSMSDDLTYVLRQQRLLVEFGVHALRATERSDMLDACVRIAAEGLNVNLAKYLEYRPATDDLLIRAGIGWQEGTVGHATLSADAGSPAGYAYRMRTPVISNHLGKDSRFRTPQVLLRHGVRRAVNVPVRDRGAPIGVLEVDSSNPGRFSEADIAFLDGLGVLVSVATERLEATDALREARERERLLIGEMRHRVRNIFSLMQGIVSMSVRQARRSGEEVVDLIVGRLDALAAATETGLPRVAQDESAGGQHQDLLALTRRVLAPYGESVVIDGADGLPPLSDRFQTVVALLLHELATNAVKHGAMAEADGRVDVCWRVDGNAIHLDWREVRSDSATDRSGAAPVGGFGTGMIDTLLGSSGGTIRRDMRPGGLQVIATLPAA